LLSIQVETTHTIAHSILGQIKSCYIMGEKSLDLEKFKVLMGQLLWESDSMLRCKGIFCVA